MVLSPPLAHTFPMPAKLRLFASDTTEVDQLFHDFMEAGIRCEIIRTHLSAHAYHVAEFMVHNVHDSHRALRLCEQRLLSFAHSPARAQAHKTAAN